MGTRFGGLSGRRQSFQYLSLPITRNSAVIRKGRQ
jgi:hypothetical protein